MKNAVIKNGVLFGVAYIFIYLALYFIQPNILMQNGFILTSSIILPLFFMAISVLNKREKNEGILTFGEGFSAAFNVFAIGFIMFGVFQILHYSLDNEFKLAHEAYINEKSIEMLEQVNNIVVDMAKDADKDEVNSNLELVRSELKNNPQEITIGLQVMNIFIGLLFPGAILALIVSLILKKKA